MDPRELREAFAANLRRLRHARGVSQEDLAHEAGINRTLSEQAREGRELPGLEIIANLPPCRRSDPARGACLLKTAPTRL